MNEFYSEGFLVACSKGNLEEAKKLLSQGVEVNFADKDGIRKGLISKEGLLSKGGNTGVFLAAMNNQLDILRFMEQNGAMFELTNRQGNTPLHFACERRFKEVILFLLLSGVDPTIKNDKGEKAGDNAMESRSFMQMIIQENKAFKVLTPTQKKKLLSIFEDIDFDSKGTIDIQKSIRFNKFVEDVSDTVAEKDAREFITSCGLCNKTTVNVDEWLFAFSKLLVADQAIYDKFIEDYDLAVVKRGGKIRDLQKAESS